MQAKVLLPVLGLLVAGYGCERRAANTPELADSPAAGVSDTAAGGAGEKGKPEILSVVVRVRTSDGTISTMNVELKGEDPTDALFLTKDAFEKFAIPFYAKQKDPRLDSVPALRRRINAESDTNGLLIILHKLRCRIVMPGGKLRSTAPFKL
jgi:hypothetical protein